MTVAEASQAGSTRPISAPSVTSGVRPRVSPNVGRFLACHAVAFILAVAPVTCLELNTSPTGASEPAPDGRPEPGHPNVRKDVWLRVETPSFTLYGEVPEARLRLVADRLQTFRGALERLHPGSRPSSRETYVYVFRNSNSGSPYAPLATSGGLHSLSANQQYDVPNYFIVAAPVDDPPLEVLYHSYAHQFLDDNFPRLPLTVTEELAEFDSGFAVTQEGTLIGTVQADHVRWLREHGVLPLAEQLSLEARSSLLTTENGKKAFVASSWALMHYLASGSGENRMRLPAFLEALQRGTPPGEAASLAFGTSLDQLQGDVAGYVHGNHFLALRIKNEEPASLTPLASSDITTRAAATPTNLGALRVRAMAEDEALAALGDLLGHTRPDRRGDAQAYQRAALRLNPNQARAYAGLGYLSYAQKRFDEAIPFLEKATEIDADAMSCYLLARSLLKVDAAAAMTTTSAAPSASPMPATAAIPVSGATEKSVRLTRVRTLLARAIELRPGFAAPYVTLGATHTLPDGDVASGIALLQTARMMLPARTDIASSLVYLFLRKGDLIRAQKLVDDALVHGGDAAALAGARTAIATFQQNIAARQSLYQPVKTKEEAAREEAARLKLRQSLRDALQSTTDPAIRDKIEKMLKGLEEHPSTMSYLEAAAIYNEAVERANQRDYAGATAMLEGLLAKVESPELKEQINAFLARLRRDAARPQPSNQ